MENRREFPSLMDSRADLQPKGTTQPSELATFVHVRTEIVPPVDTQRTGPVISPRAFISDHWTELPCSVMSAAPSRSPE
ncbi:hypothetical protein TNCV_3314221 [Trichonephila clavipes]|nr:hypothetical protein TNCV_3314221 [Trichonephila clavipes]